MAAPSLISFKGKTQSTRAWAKELGLAPQLLRDRLKRGWPLTKALSSERTDLRAHYGKAESLTCTICNENKTIAEFRRYADSKSPEGFRVRRECKICAAAKWSEWRRDNLAERRAYSAKWRAENPVAAKAIDKRKRLKHEYKLTTLQAEEILKSNDGRCAIRDRHRTLVIDHCHNTGRVRGPLCHGCNSVVGKVEAHPELLERVARYLAVGGHPPALVMLRGSEAASPGEPDRCHASVLLRLSNAPRCDDTTEAGHGG